MVMLLYAHLAHPIINKPYLDPGMVLHQSMSPLPPPRCVPPSGLNSPGGISRVALLPLGSSKTAAEALMHIEDAQARRLSLIHI